MVFADPDIPYGRKLYVIQWETDWLSHFYRELQLFLVVELRFLLDDDVNMLFEHYLFMATVLKHFLCAMVLCYSCDIFSLIIARYSSYTDDTFPVRGIAHKFKLTTKLNEWANVIRHLSYIKIKYVLSKLIICFQKRVKSKPQIMHITNKYCFHRLPSAIQRINTCIKS